MDYRELTVIYQESLRKTVENNLNLLTLVRVSQSQKEGYEGVVNEMKSKLIAIQMGAEETIRQSWAELKKRGG